MVFFFFFFFANINGNDCRFSRGHWGRHHLQKLMPIFHLIRFEAYYTNTLYILCVYNQTGHRTTPWDGNWGKKKREDKDGLQAADGFALIAAYERNNLLSFLFLVVVVVVVVGGIFKNRWNKKETLKKWLSWQLMPLHLISIFLIYTHAYQLFKNESIYVRRPCIFI